MLSYNSAIVTCLCVVVLMRFASAQGYGNTVMISSEIPYFVSDIMQGRGMTVTWPDTRLVNVIPSNSLQFTAPNGARPDITQVGGMPITVQGTIPSLVPSNGMPNPVMGENPRLVPNNVMPNPVMGGMPRLVPNNVMPNPVIGSMPGSMPSMIPGTGIQTAMPGFGMPSMPGMGIPFLTGDMVDVLGDYYKAIGRLQLLGIGQPFGTSGYQYPQQRPVTSNGRAVPRTSNRKTTRVSQPISAAKGTKAAVKTVTKQLKVSQPPTTRA